MSKKTLKNLKIISIICVIVLLLEIIYVGYKVLCQGKESVYFEGVNEMIIGNDYLVTVGSNNNNDNHYEKAKISKYNKNKEKQFERLFSVGYNSSYFGIIEDDNYIYILDCVEHFSKYLNLFLLKNKTMTLVISKINALSMKYH